MSESTNILDLPTDPVGGDSNNSIIMTATENSSNSSLSLDQTTINQIVNGLQKATINGSTLLPSRDIPMTTTSYSNDPQIQANYVPPPPINNSDYIQNYEQTSDMIKTYNKRTKNENSLDNVYNEIQTPLLVAVIYFLFQLPFFKNFLFRFLPVLFSKDGNFNMNGYLFTSVLFGILFYSFNKLTVYFNAF
jgi:hypothetical protein